jgi:hypothetical protein
MIIRWARFPTPGVGFRADPLIMASEGAVVTCPGCMIGVSARSRVVVARFRAEVLIMCDHTAFGGAARRKGRPGPAREAGR